MLGKVVALDPLYKAIQPPHATQPSGCLLASTMCQLLHGWGMPAGAGGTRGAHGHPCHVALVPRGPWGVPGATWVPLGRVPGWPALPARPSCRRVPSSSDHNSTTTSPNGAGKGGLSSPQHAGSPTRRVPPGLLPAWQEHGQNMALCCRLAGVPARGGHLGDLGHEKGWHGDPPAQF